MRVYERTYSRSHALFSAETLPGVASKRQVQWQDTTYLLWNKSSHENLQHLLLGIAEIKHSYTVKYIYKIDGASSLFSPPCKSNTISLLQSTISLLQYFIKYYTYAGHEMDYQQMNFCTKGLQHEIFSIGFFHEKVPHGPQFHPIIFFRIWLRFGGDIRKNRLTFPGQGRYMESRKRILR